MTQSLSTCWTVIGGAARGNADDREQFARRYAQVIRGYLLARWSNSPCREEVEDAVQEVFVECFKRGGILERVDSSRAGGFRAFLHGAVRHVALRVEDRRARARQHQPASTVDLEAVAEPGEAPPRAFERAWAEALLREAAQRQEELARAAGEAALRRVELLRLRFHDGLPIRDIARRWQADPTVLHHEYARARKEFKQALLEVVAFHHPGPPAEVEQECANLLAVLR
jgi:RNA polymerase sigma-70 factor (ECF subfamily)